MEIITLVINSMALGVITVWIIFLYLRKKKKVIIVSRDLLDKIHGLGYVRGISSGIQIASELEKKPLSEIATLNKKLEAESLEDFHKILDETLFK